MRLSTPPAEPAIRRAVNADGETIAALIAAVFAEYEGCVFDWSEFPELRAPDSSFSERGGAIWIAERNGVVVGSIATAPAAEERAYELFKVYVAREERGTGLAARLLDTALRFAAEHGAQRIVLWTDTRFHAGHRFYEKNNFVRLPGERFLADLSDSWEYAFARDLTAFPPETTD